jgi:hypothetical protein
MKPLIQTRCLYERVGRRSVVDGRLELQIGERVVADPAAAVDAASPHEALVGLVVDEFLGFDLVHDGCRAGYRCLQLHGKSPG